MRSTLERRWLFGLVALCLLASLLYWRATTEPREIRRVEQSITTAPAAEPALIQSSETGATERRLPLTVRPDEAAAPDPRNAPIAVLRGRVVSAPGIGRTSAPVAGAELRHETRQPMYLTHGERPTSTTSAEDGRFELPLRIGGRNPLTISAQGFVSHRITVDPVADAREGYLDLGDVVLAEAIMVSGHVVDLRGQAIASARILFVDPCEDDVRGDRSGILDKVLAVTGQDGGFRVPVCPSIGTQSSWTLTSLHDDFRPAYHHGVVAQGSGEQRPITIVMDDGASIAGRVIGLSRQELQHAGPLAVAVAPRILLGSLQDDWEYDPSARRVQVQPDGTFLVGGLRAEETVALAVWTGGIDKASFTVRRSAWCLGTALRTPSTDSGVELHYLEPASLRARFVDEAGLAVERLSVDASLSAIVMAGDEPRPLMEMAIFPDGIVQWLCRASDMEEENGLWVHAVDEDGQVALSWQGAAPKLAAGVSIDLGDLTLVPLDREAPDDTSPTRTIEVLALDRHGEPLPHAPIELAGAAAPSKRLRLKRSDASGRASFQVPAEEGFLVRVDVDRRREWTAPLHRHSKAAEAAAPWTPVPPEREDAVLTLSSPGTAGARMAVSYGGRPLAGAAIVLQWTPASPTAFSVPGSSEPRVPRLATPHGERTDGAGAWSCHAMIPGDWTAFVDHPQLRMPEVFSFTLEPGDNEIELARSQAALEGRVVDADGLPVPGASVRADFANSSPLLAIRERDKDRMTARPGGNREDLTLRDIRYCRADSSGRFRLEGVEPGVELRALAMAPGFVIAVSEPTVVDGGTTIDLGELSMERAGSLQVSLPSGMEGEIRMSLVPDGDPAGDSAGAPTEDLDERRSTIFDAERVEGLQPGRWTVKVSYRASGSASPDSTEHTEAIDVRAGETNVIDLRPAAR
ncbi:hypothetical protein Poly30_34210 [Planctomycetes bacterium Poly30]|uniref:Nickel uptake substrate-specific transmembrane region n=1 Tax=Saltatorellus ferox TaxID=2528018 RepID=A0A518EUW1_9BACT|nr:hypothetical protein Poly30_34210 [Planctomycetes bacterium Poly30]